MKSILFSVLLVLSSSASYGGARADFEKAAMNPQSVKPEVKDLVLKELNRQYVLSSDPFAIEVDSTDYPQYDQETPQGYSGSFFLSNKDVTCRAKIKAERDLQGKLFCPSGKCYSTCFKKNMSN